MKKVFLTFAIIGAVCSTANAQFRMDKDYPTAGIKVVTDTLGATRTVTVDFNTDKALTVMTDKEGIKAQTQRGVQVKVYNDLGAEAAAYAKCNNYGANGNPIHVSGATFLRDYLSVDSLPAYADGHQFWKSVASLFTVDSANPSNQAFGVYPGMYKKVDYRFYFNFEGYEVNSDIELDIQTLDEGNTAKKAKYKLMLSIGSDKTSISETDGKTPDYVLADFYETGSGLKHIKLAETFGVEPSVFTNKKVYIAFYTDGTGDAIQHGKYDPIIAFDNFTVQLKLASWLTPAAGAEANADLNNSDSPVKNISLNADTLIFPMYITSQGRVGELAITNDIASDQHANKKFSFLPELGVKMKDASGNFVDVAYTHTPDVLGTNGSWSKEKITLAKPTTFGQEEFLVYLKYVKKESDVDGLIISDKFELSNGTRIWYTFSGKVDLSVPGLSVEGSTADANAINVYTKSGKVFVTNLNTEAEIYTIAGVLVKKVSIDEAERGIALSTGVYLVSVKGGITKKIVIN